MTNNNYDKYVSKFESLADKANYTRGSAELYDMFLEGLPTGILYDVLKPLTPLTYDALKDKVRALAQGKAIINGLLHQWNIRTQGGGGGMAYQRVNNNNQRCPFPQTIGEEDWEDKEEETDNSITPPMPHHPWIILLYQWIYPEAVHQLTGEDEEVKEDGTKEDTKEEWLKGLEIQAMPVSTADKWVTMPGTAHEDKGRTPNQISSISMMMTNQNFPWKTRYLTSGPKSTLWHPMKEISSSKNLEKRRIFPQPD